MTMRMKRKRRWRNRENGSLTYTCPNGICAVKWNGADYRHISGTCLIRVNPKRAALKYWNSYTPVESG